jgi:beta-glucosidase
LTWRGLGSFEASGAFPTFVPVQFQQNGVLQFDVRVHQAPAAKVSMTMDCGEKCVATLNLSKSFQSYVGGGVKTVKIPLSCFVQAGADLSKVKAPFSVLTDGTFKADFASIKLVAAADKDADTLSCANLK